jgi:REP element-mobilizing transposase RayT
MRKSRVTWQGAYHHVMNRGMDGENIFADSDLKRSFLEMLQEKSRKLKIRLFAYCIMDNHYHLVLENSSGKMSDFFRQLNGKYALNYRRKIGGRGYVFQDRFKSVLIENDSYLIVSILYTMRNPVTAGIVEKYNDYRWSSANEYFKGKVSESVDSEYIQELFGSKDEFERQIRTNRLEVLPVEEAPFGEVLGGRDFIEKAVEKFNRRKRSDAVKRKRVDDRYFEPAEKVFQEFESMKGVKIDDIDVTSHRGKRLRGELLVLLKDLTELRYSDIAEFPIFNNLQLSSLGSLYKSTRRRLEK